MTAQEAQEIINAYIKTGKSGVTSQPVTDLPHSPGKIKYAHFVLAEELIRRGLFTEEANRKLKVSYSELDKFYSEDSERINNEHQAYLQNLKEGIIVKDPTLWLVERALDDEIEFSNFVADLHGNWNH